MHLEHHLVGGYVRYISPHIIIIINVGKTDSMSMLTLFESREGTTLVMLA